MEEEEAGQEKAGMFVRHFPMRTKMALCGVAYFSCLVGFLLVSLPIAVNSMSQPTEASSQGVIWDRILKNEGNEGRAWVIGLQDEDYMVAASVDRENQPSKLIVWGIDKDGNQLWRKTFKTACQYISLVVGLGREELLVVGHTNPGRNVKDEVYLAKIDAREGGGIVWERIHGGNESWSINSAAQSADGGTLLGGCAQSLEQTRQTYAINGTTYGHTGYEQDMLVFKIEANGEMVWERVWNHGWDDRVEHLQSSGDGGYLVWGPGRPKEGILVAKMDDSGNLISQKNTKLEFEVSSAPTCQTRDGGFVLAYFHYSLLPGHSISVVKLDKNGDLQWQRRYPIGERHLSPRCVVEAPEGGIVVFCEEYGHEEYRPSLMYMLKVEEDGEAKKKELKIELDLDSVTPIRPIRPEGQGYILAGTPITWMVKLPLTRLYDTDTRLVRVDVDWGREEVFAPAKEVDPIWARFPVHGEEPTAIDRERGYCLIQQDIKCTVYYTADFVRIDHSLAVEILNKSLESIQVRVPYGANQIRTVEEIQPSATLAYYKSAQLDAKIEREGDETVISISLLPEMVEKGKAMISVLYRVFDLPGGEGVLVFDEAYREGNARWQKGTLVRYSPGSFDQGTWILNFEMIPNSEEIIPAYWEPVQGAEALIEHDNWHGLRWQFVGEMPREPVFKALFRYPA